ncbi:hypothetical protein ACHWQZ_G012266 [Mnemiopsis leidyi]
MSYAAVVKAITVCSGLVGALGTFTNSISLSYFIGRGDKGLSRQLFILLNIFDLLVCGSDVLSIAFYYCKGASCGYTKFPFRAVFAVLDVSIESTGFATCLLGVTRAVSVCLPFYQIVGKVLNAVTAAYLGQVIFRALLRFYFYYVDLSKLNFYMEFDNAVMIVLLTVFILVNTTSSALLSWKLLAKRDPSSPTNQESMMRGKRRATITVLIVSTCFLIFNTIFGVCLYAMHFVEEEEAEDRLNIPILLVNTDGRLDDS